MFVYCINQHSHLDNVQTSCLLLNVTFCSVTYGECRDKPVGKGHYHTHRFCLLTLSLHAELLFRNKCIFKGWQNPSCVVSIADNTYLLIIRILKIPICHTLFTISKRFLLFPSHFLRNTASEICSLQNYPLSCIYLAISLPNTVPRML